MTHSHGDTESRLEIGGHRRRGWPFAEEHLLTFGMQQKSRWLRYYRHGHPLLREASVTYISEEEATYPNCTVSAMGDEELKKAANHDLGVMVVHRKTDAITSLV